MQAAQNVDRVRDECGSLNAAVAAYDARARQPQPGWRQDRLREMRKAARDRQFALKCWHRCQSEPFRGYVPTIRRDRHTALKASSVVDFLFSGVAQSNVGAVAQIGISANIGGKLTQFVAVPRDVAKAALALSRAGLYICTGPAAGALLHSPGTNHVIGFESHGAPETRPRRRGIVFVEPRPSEQILDAGKRRGAARRFVLRRPRAWPHPRETQAHRALLLATTCVPPREKGSRSLRAHL